MTIREWLRANKYQDIDDLIGEVMAEFKRTGSKERRNWADTLAGGKAGEGLVVAGREFPVLASAQKSRGKKITTNAIMRNKTEEFPEARVSGRWHKKNKAAIKPDKTFQNKRAEAVSRSRTSKLRSRFFSPAQRPRLSLCLQWDTAFGFT